METSLSMKESTRLEAALCRVGDVLVSGLTATRACCLAVDYVIPLTSEPPVMTFTILSRVGSAGCSSWRASHLEIFFPLSESKS